MSKKVIEKALTKQVTQRIKDGQTYGMESGVEEAVTDKLKKSGSIGRVADAVINRTKTVQNREPMGEVAPGSPRKKASQKKRKAGDYLRNW